MGTQKGCILIKWDPRASVLLQPHGGGDSEMREKRAGIRPYEWREIVMFEVILRDAQSVSGAGIKNNKNYHINYYNLTCTGIWYSLGKYFLLYS